MKLFLVFCLLIFTSCANQTTAQLSENSSNQQVDITIKETPTPSATVTNKPVNKNDDFDLCKDYEQIEIPKTTSPIGKIDFKNLTFPKIWQKGSVKLKNGCVGEVYKVGGGCEFTLNSVDFVDFNKDDVDEALVEIGNFCGNGSSSYSTNFLIYGIQNKKVNLL